MNYVINRHLFKDGAYSVNLNGFSKEAIWGSIISKVMPLASDQNQMLKYLKGLHVILQLNIVDPMEEKDKENLLEILQ